MKLLYRKTLKTTIILCLLFSSVITYSQYKIILPDTISGEEKSEIKMYKSNTFKINEFSAINSSCIADEYGEFDDWIELYNFSNNQVNLNGTFITDDLSEPDKFQITSDIFVEGKSFIVLWADDTPEQGNTHLGFKLSGAGEEIGVYTSEMLLIDSKVYAGQLSDVSMGRQPDGSFEWNFFTEPTPGSTNITQGNLGITEQPASSMPGGFYMSSVNIVLGCETEDAVIFYTLDGSIPTQSSILYSEEFTISESTILRAGAFKNGYIDSKIMTHSFLFNQNSTIDIISLVTQDDNFFGSSGIYDHPHSGIEKPIHIEAFTPSGDLKFSLDAGVKIHSPDSRAQKSLRLYARSEYGTKEINYQVFPDKNINIFKRLVLRNGGNDGLEDDKTQLRDPLVHKMYKHSNPDNANAAYLPVNVYINGDYWGIYNLRERQDIYYIQENFNYEGDIDFLEFAADAPDMRNAIEGDWEHFDMLADYVIDNDLSSEQHYSHVSNLMDIENFTDYQIYEIFIGNQDWLSNNIKFWRPRTETGKWKWVLWDTEYGLGRYRNYPIGQPDYNYLHMALTWGGWGEDDYTYLLRNLMENESFKHNFCNRFADLLNTEFKENSYIDNNLNALSAVIEPELAKQFDRWGGNIEFYQTDIDYIKYFVEGRPFYVREHIVDEFDFTGTFNLFLDTDSEEAGRIDLNTISVTNFPWTGIYFDDVPVTLTAVPNPGYVFLRWQQTSSTENPITITSSDDISLTAIFEETVQNIIINEINYNSSIDFDTEDWVELYNPTENNIDISNWKFKDSDDAHIFIFPENTEMAPDEYLVLCQNQIMFSSHHSEITNYIGDFDFGLSGSGELIRLYEETGELADEVEYDDNSPWPVSPDGNGPTLELINPSYDNSLAQSWGASGQVYGSPGEPNTAMGISNKRNQKTQIIPNPFSGNTRITVNYHENIQNGTFQVFNRLGQEVYANKSINSNSFTFSGSELKPGIYYGRLIVGTEIIDTFKLVVL